MSTRFTGFHWHVTLADGREIHSYGKTRKGELRDHRKRKCGAFCRYCFAEATEGARYPHVRYRP